MAARLFLLLGAVSAFSGVVLGAFGAHGLKTLVTPELLEVYKTGVAYQMWHALGLLVVGLLQQQAPEAKLLRWAGWLLLTGIVLFSGSLYLLVILNIKALGIITPFGGVAFLLAWGCLIGFVWKQPHA